MVIKAFTGIIRGFTLLIQVFTFTTQFDVLEMVSFAVANDTFSGVGSFQILAILDFISGILGFTGRIRDFDKVIKVFAGII